MSKWTISRAWSILAYWGDKLLTLIYLLLFGLLIISWRLITWGYTMSIKGLKRFFGAIQTYRDGKRHKRDWKEYGRRPENRMPSSMMKTRDRIKE